MGGGSQGLQDLLVDGVGQRQGLVQQGLALLAVLVGKGLVLDTADVDEHVEPGALDGGLEAQGGASPGRWRRWR